MSLRVSNGNIVSVRQGLKPLQGNNGQISQKQPLQISNGQIHSTNIVKNLKVTAKADSTGVENVRQGQVLIKHHHSVKKPQTPSVARRNARERNRVKVVNSGFDILKNHVPHLKSKVSKVETLKAAVDYIAALKEMLGEKIDMDNLPIFNILSDNHDDRSLDMDTSPGYLHQDSRINSSSDDIQEITLNPMVYQLPSTPTLTIPTTMPSISIYQPSMLSPNSSVGMSPNGSVGSSEMLTVNMSPPIVTSPMNQSMTLSPSGLSLGSPQLTTADDDKSFNQSILLPTISTLAPSTIILTPGSRLPSITAPAWWPQVTQLTNSSGIHLAPGIHLAQPTLDNMTTVSSMSVADVMTSVSVTCSSATQREDN